MKNELDYATLYEKHYTKAVFFVRSITQLDVEECEDIVSDVFLRLIEMGDEQNIQYSISSYFYTMLRNQAWDVLRRRLRAERVLSTVALSLDSITDDQLTEMCHKELFQIIGETIKRFPASRKAIFYDFHEEGCTYREIAKKYHITDRSVEYNIKRSKMSIRKRVIRLCS